MIEEQKIIDTELNNLLDKVNEFYNSGYRLVQIGCLRKEALVMTYSFDKDYHFISLRLTLSLDQLDIPSISKIYWCAFLYENEIKDLFGLKIKDIAVDYKGNFYRTAVKWPFNPKETKKEK